MQSHLPDKLNRTKAVRRKMLATFMAGLLAPGLSQKLNSTYHFSLESWDWKVHTGRMVSQSPPTALCHRSPWLLIDSVA